MNKKTTKKVVIDASHGGDDTGIIHNNFIEKEFN